MRHAHIPRRDFLKASSAIAVAGTLPIARSAHAAGGDEIRLALIGCGGKARDNRQQAEDYADVVAFCDLDRTRVEKFADGTSADIYSDYRKLLESNDVDAVMIGSPDHWHSVMVCDSARAGKDMYCEKPISLTIGESRAMVDTMNRYATVYQAGHQRRQRAVERGVGGVERPGTGLRADAIADRHESAKQVRGPTLQAEILAGPIGNVAIPQNDPIEGVASDETPLRRQLDRCPRPFVQNVEQSPVRGHQRGHACHVIVVP